MIMCTTRSEQKFWMEQPFSTTIHVGILGLQFRVGALLQVIEPPCAIKRIWLRQISMSSLAHSWFVVAIACSDI